MSHSASFKRNGFVKIIHIYAGEVDILSEASFKAFNDLCFPSAAIICQLIISLISRIDVKRESAASHSSPALNYC